MNPNNKAHDALFQDLLNAQTFVWNDAPYQHDLGPDEEETLDFRIQLVDGVASLHTGDACYDTDHQGSWGAGSVGPNDEACDVWDALETAYDEAQDAAACHELADRPETDVAPRVVPQVAPPWKVGLAGYVNPHRTEG